MFLSDASWDFPLLAQTDEGVGRFSARSHFFLHWESFCPLLIGVVFDPRGTDRYRMLAQAAIVARLANFLTRRDDQQFVVHAIYITENYEAEWYLVYADPNDVRNSMSVPYV